MSLAAEPTVFPGDAWEEASPDSQGADKAKLAKAVDLLSRTIGKDGARELVIIRHGRIIWKGDNVDKQHGVWSVTKSFTSTVLGLLIEDGKCTLVTRIADVLPEMRASYADVTLRNFATMTSGYRAIGDAKAGEVSHGQSKTPFRPDPEPLFSDSRFAYWDSAMNVFALALTKIAGEPLEPFFRRRVAEPIGIMEWKWGDFGKIDGILVNGGAGNAERNVFISARELARFGLLFLNQGKWNGRQLVSASWVKEATQVQVPPSLSWAHPESKIDGRGVYGYNWWCNGVKPDGTRKYPAAPAGMFWASGHNNNRCFVIPEWDMVIVRMGLDGRAQDEVWNGFFAKVSEAVAPAK
jgi:CubicO group peptidase (beta-lactamase class C family)